MSTMVVDNGIAQAMGTRKNTRTSTMLSFTFDPAVSKDIYGFLVENKDAHKYGMFIEKHLHDSQVQQDRLELFKREGGVSLFDTELLHPYDENITKNDHNHALSEDDKKKLLKLGAIVRGGIPANMREEMWVWLAGVHQKPLHRGIYQSLLDNTPLTPTLVFDQIEKDLARTFPGFTFTPTGHEFQPALRRVLRAYSKRNPSVGYCQSMNFIAGGLLVFLEEEEAFWVLCWLVENVLHGYFTKTMIGLQVDSKLFEILLKDNLPTLSKHLQKIGLHYIFFTAQWFLCLFLNNMHSEASFRVWDALLFYGTKVLLEVALNIFRIYEKELLACVEQTEVVTFLGKRMFEMLDISELLNTPIKKYDAKKMEAKKIKYFEKIKKDVTARHYTLQLIELTRLTQFSKTELEHMVVQFRELEAESESLGVNTEVFGKVLLNIFKWQYDENFMKRLFYVFDSDQDSTIDFKEMICCVSALCRGTLHQKLKIIFRMFDINEDQCIDKDEMTKVLHYIYNACGKNASTTSPPNSPTNPRNTFNFSSNTDTNTVTFTNYNLNVANNNTTTITRNRSSSVGRFGGIGFMQKLFGSNAEEEQQTYKRVRSTDIILPYNRTPPKPTLDYTKEVAFFVDMLFKAAPPVSKTQTSPQIIKRHSRRMSQAVNAGGNGLTFEQFKEVVLLQPLVVQCFHLGTSAPLYNSLIDIRL